MLPAAHLQQHDGRDDEVEQLEVVERIDAAARQKLDRHALPVANELMVALPARWSILVLRVRGDRAPAGPNALLDV
eukprot:5291933-Prymnesium_polylepis.2